MVGVLEMLRGIVDRAPEYAFFTDAERARAKQTMDHGVDCILKTQITQNGKLTVWCAQHDEKTLAPAKARAYEHPSLSGSESVGIVEFLMAIERPSPAVGRAIEGAVSWLRENKIAGIRVVRKPAPAPPKGYDTTVMQDSAPPPRSRG